MFFFLFLPLRSPTTKTLWGRRGTPSSPWEAILTPSAVWRSTLKSRCWLQLQRITRWRCGTCRKQLLPKSMSRRAAADLYKFFWAKVPWWIQEKFALTLSCLSVQVCSSWCGAHLHIPSSQVSVWEPRTWTQTHSRVKHLFKLKIMLTLSCLQQYCAVEYAWMNK